MEHKRPVLRPKCIGRGRAQTQIPFIHSFISESTLEGVKSRVSCVTGSSSFPGKSVILLPAHFGSVSSDRSGHSEENYSVSPDILLRGHDDGA